MRGLHPEAFELRLHRVDYAARTVIEVWSRKYDIRLGFTLRDTWGDPRPLADFIEALVGGTVRAWEDARIGAGSGREMAQALMPIWEREIHRYMERLEYQGRHRDRWYYAQPDRYVTWGDWLDAGSLAPREDPKAKEKARQLLMRNLDEGQLKSFKKDGAFRVTAKDGKVYTISTARSFNVKAEDGTKYCGQLRDTPIEDQMLAQKLLLQSDPEKFFKNANVSPALPSGDLGFVQSGTGITATEINTRYNEIADMMRLRPGAIVPWDSSV